MTAEREQRAMNRLPGRSRGLRLRRIPRGTVSLAAQRDMHVAALRPARTQNAHGGGAAARSGGELEPDLLPALLPHAGRPSESGSLPHAGAARILQNRSARTAGAAMPSNRCFSERRDCWRSIRTTPTRSTSPAISNIWRPNTTSNRCGPELGSWATYARPTTPYCGWRKPRNSSLRTSSSWSAPWPAARRGDPAALLRRGLGLLADAPYSGNRRRRQAQASGDFQGQHHRHQPRLGAAIRLRQLHRTRSPARQRPDAARTPARGGQPLHARLARRGLTPRQRLRVAGPVAAGDGILRRQTVRGVPRRAAHPEQSENRKQLTLPPCKNKHH